MNRDVVTQNNIIKFKPQFKNKQTQRKEGINKNKGGSVRKINGNVYVDFSYLGERVREPSGLKWNDENKKTIRELLDEILIKIKRNEFIFAETFPFSKKKDYFTDLEFSLLKRIKQPDYILFKDYIWEWYNLRKDSESLSGRTLNGYKGYIERYLIPFFGDRSFGSFNKVLFDQFISWAKEQKYRKKPVTNSSIQKYFVVLKMVCKDATIKNGWVGLYDPFFSFKMPKTTIRAYEKIFPFSSKEQIIIITFLPDHWKPYFEFAFASGVRQGEQRAFYLEDIYWDQNYIDINKSITLNEKGKVIEGPCKNAHSRRKIKLSPNILSALQKQKMIYDQYKGKYFFCNEEGNLIDPSNLREKVWIPTLEKAGLEYRDMKQTRHSFGTYQLSKGTDPLKIGKVMGHRDAEMVLKVYGKYIDDGTPIED